MKKIAFLKDTILTIIKDHVFNFDINAYVAETEIRAFKENEVFEADVYEHGNFLDLILKTGEQVPHLDLWLDPFIVIE